MFDSLAWRDDSQPHLSTATTSLDPAHKNPLLRTSTRAVPNPLCGGVQARAARAPGAARRRALLPAALLGAERLGVPGLHRLAVDWQEVAELMESSYRQVALKRMLKALDG
jgi:hypothetical protein